MQIASSDAGVATGDTVRIDKVSTAQSAPISIPDSDGRLRFSCGSCGYSAKLASTYAGKAIACPECKSPQLIPPLQAPESSVGKTMPPLAPALATTAQAEDELAFDNEPAAAPAKTVKNPAAQAVAHDPLDDISFDQEPLGQAASPFMTNVANSDVLKPPAKTKSIIPSSRGDSSAQPSSSKPGSGKIVRRGNRMALATTADLPDDDDSLDEQPPKPSKPLPPWVQKMKEPRMMTIVGSSVALLIVLVVLISAWSNASSDAKTYEERAIKAETLSATLKKGKSDVEIELSNTQSELKGLKKSNDEAKTALVAAETRLAELNEKAKQAEAQKDEEIAKRKKADNAYSESFANEKKLQKQRDEDYQRSNDLRKKYEEEMKLRKDLQERLQILGKEQAAAK